MTKKQKAAIKFLDQHYAKKKKPKRCRIFAGKGIFCTRCKKLIRSHPGQKNHPAPMLNFIGTF